MYLHLAARGSVAMANKRSEAALEAWTLDQLAKSAFFLRKLHAWQLMEVGEVITQVQGEHLNWDNLQITPSAWNKVIHRGIKPVIVFAHPEVLRSIPGSAGYYRMLAMVSQKSMKNVGLNLDRYEMGRPMAHQTLAERTATHLNSIISLLVEADDGLSVRDFDLWRGMAAGSQAQGSWQNNKGSVAEKVIRELVLKRLQEKGIPVPEDIETAHFLLSDQRELIFSSEPDLAIRENGTTVVAVEIKGGIDPAAVLERLGAALKSLQRTRLENPASVTVLILQDVSITSRAKSDLGLSLETVNHLFSTRDIVQNEGERERFFSILQI